MLLHPFYQQALADKSLTQISLHERIALPALLLQTEGALFGLAAAGLVFLSAGAFWGGKDPIEAVVLAGIFALFLGISGAFIFLGGVRLRRLRSYGLVLGAIIYGMVLTFFLCFPLSLLGVWPLVVMLNPVVKQAFRSSHP